jgi:hypothetical protein
LIIRSFDLFWDKCEFLIIPLKKLETKYSEKVKRKNIKRKFDQEANCSMLNNKEQHTLWLLSIKLTTQLNVAHNPFTEIGQPSGCYTTQSIPTITVYRGKLCTMPGTNTLWHNDFSSLPKQHMSHSDPFTFFLMGQSENKRSIFV